MKAAELERLSHTFLGVDAQGLSSVTTLAETRLTRDDEGVILARPLHVQAIPSGRGSCWWSRSVTGRFSVYIKV